MFLAQLGEQLHFVLLEDHNCEQKKTGDVMCFALASVKICVGLLFEGVDT